MAIVLCALPAAYAQTIQAEVDWKAMIPAIRELLKSKPENSDPQYAVGIRKTADLTGDGTAEALVYTGGGGAYTDYLVLIRVVKNQPKLAEFKDKNGRKVKVGFGEGSSVMHTVGVDLVPESRAVFSYHYDLSGDVPQKLVACDGEAYQWNPKTETFDYSRRLSTQLKQARCRQVGGR